MAPQGTWRQQRPRQGVARVGKDSKPQHCASLSALQSFFVGTAPVVTVQGEEGCLAGRPTSHFLLRDLWAAYDEWSAYGVEIPMRVATEGGYQEIIQCYTPYLSGLQLFGADHTRRIRCPPSGYTSEDEAVPSSSCTSSSYSPSDSGSSSTASVDSDCEADSSIKDCSSPGSADASDQLKAHAFHEASGAGAAEHGASVLRRQQPLGEPGKPLFEFFEQESPYARSPLADRIAELAEDFPGLQSLSTRDLHPASWVAIAWYPIYRLPAVAEPSLSRDLQASVLTFHSLSVPPSLPAELCARSSAHPVPPPPCAPAAAALAWRSETARQQLLASALSALAVQPASGEAPPGGPSAAACEPSCCLSAVQVPVSVTCLRPFAFMPYKMSGRTWVDDYNLRSQHLPMISAAGMWLERRNVRLPDFEFFSRNFRPLPTMHR
ncbi:hypothetical protein N2152v2_008431 [Parachlorella kessleri]